jgi:hypothetical protein
VDLAPKSNDNRRPADGNAASNKNSQWSTGGIGCSVVFGEDHVDILYSTCKGTKVKSVESCFRRIKHVRARGMISRNYLRLSQKSRKAFAVCLAVRSPSVVDQNLRPPLQQGANDDGRVD